VRSSGAADRVEQQLAATLGERQIAELVEDHQVDAGQPVGDAAGAAELDPGFELVDEVDDVEEARLLARTNAASGNGDRKMRLAGAGSTDRHDVALLSKEAAARQVAHQLLVDRRAGKGEVGQLLGERQL